MATKQHLVLWMLTSLITIPSLIKSEFSQEAREMICPPSDSFSRYSFPEGFLFGASSSAYQYEGATAGDGRGLSLWDEFTHRHSEWVDDHSTADIAVDFYNQYRDDIKIMKDMHLNAFRLSISWTRILPHGKKCPKEEREDECMNQKGIQFYDDLIEELLQNNIEPVVTLFHWETPITLEANYGGFLSRKIVDDFWNFAKLCFELYGKKVKNWSTFNEPWVYSVAGYDKGKKAPGRCSKWVKDTCEDGDSAVEPYIVTHNQLLAHVAAVKEFRECKARGHCDGKIGIVNPVPWLMPFDKNSELDKVAVNRSLDFVLGWFMHPLTFGDYPEVMIETVGDRLPAFTEQESEDLKKSLDFMGLNYYGAFYATHLIHIDPREVSYSLDHGVDWRDKPRAAAANPNKSSDIIPYPMGLRGLLNHIKNNYNNPEIYVTENGLDENINKTVPVEKALNDTDRRNYVNDHLWNLEKALCRDKVNVKGYIVWSFLDDFEWQGGYNPRFGLVHVDYRSKSLPRHMRKSGKWYKNFLQYKDGKPKPWFNWHSFVDFLQPKDKFLEKSAKAQL